MVNQANSAKKKKKKLHNPVRCKLKEGRKKYFIRERERS